MRIKTEEEFVRDFGDDWRNDVTFCWNDSMDHLLGRKLSKEQYEYSMKNHGHIQGWSISRDMVCSISKAEALCDKLCR